MDNYYYAVILSCVSLVRDSPAVKFILCDCGALAPGSAFINVFYTALLGY